MEIIRSKRFHQWSRALPQTRHARACPGHPRLSGACASKTRMAGTNPAMTKEQVIFKWSDAENARDLRLTRRPSWLRIHGHVGGCWDLHQNGLSSGSDLDSALLESPLHAAVEFALHRPATAVGAANLADDRRHRAVYLVDAPQFKIAADRLPVFGLAAHFSDDVLQYLPGAVGVFLVGNIDADSRIAGATAGIGNRRHGAERHDVHRAVGGPQANGADRNVLDGPGETGHRDVVTDLDGIFQQQKQPGNEVLHQFLRAEADGDADDSGAGQQRRNVDADFAQRRQADHRDDQAQ